MVYPEFKMSHGGDELTVEALNIVSWKRDLVESDEGEAYKGLAVQLDGAVLHKWTMTLILGESKTSLAKKIYIESVRERYNRGLPGGIEVDFIDNVERENSKTFKVLLTRFSPSLAGKGYIAPVEGEEDAPVIGGRDTVEIELIEMCRYLYVPTFTIGAVNLNQSEMTRYSSQAVIESEKADSWEWSLDLILDKPKMEALMAVWSSYSSAKRAYELSQDAIEEAGDGEGTTPIPPTTSMPTVQVNDGTGAGLSSAGCQIVSFSQTTSFKGYEVSIALRRGDLEDEIDEESKRSNWTFSIGGTGFAGKEIKSAKVSPVITMGIDIIPTGTTVITDNCGGGVLAWNCSFESTRAKCNAVVLAGKSQRNVLATSGNLTLIPVGDGVNGAGGNCVIESAEADIIEDKPGKWSLTCSLREVNA